MPNRLPKIIIILAACLFFFPIPALAAGNTIDTGEYMFVDSGKKVQISSGEVFYPVKISATEIVRCKNADCSSDERIYKTADGYSIRGENYWQGTNTTFRYEDKNGNPATWIPSQMTVGEVYKTQFYVKGYKIEGNNLVAWPGAPNTGTDLKNAAVRLDYTGPIQFPSGVKYEDVAKFTVTEGPGAGEVFYYAKGVGWIGWQGPSGSNLPTSSPVDYSGPAPQLQSVGQSTPNQSLTGQQSAAADNPEINISLRGWDKVANPSAGDLTLQDYDHPIDPGAPQFTGLIKGNPYPTFTNLYKMKTLASDAPGSSSSWADITMVGFGTQQGQEILLPPSGYDIGGGYQAIVLYADKDSLTLKYTREDDIVNGYTLHLENLAVNPEILALYNQANASGRSQLPALSAFQLLGTALGNELLVAIRDTGAFMDPRWVKDWWQKLVQAGIPLPPELLNILFPKLAPFVFTPEMTCSNSPFPDKGPFRPEPCDGCGTQPIDNVPPTYSCAKSFEVGQYTWVNVTKFVPCPPGSVDANYVQPRTWGGNVEVKIDDTKVPFAGYHDRPEGIANMEAEYLAQYFTGTFNRYGAECDYQDPDCQWEIFQKAGVMSKILPAEIQDRYRCKMIEKVQTHQEYNYEVWDGDPQTPKMTVSSFFSHKIPCLRFELPVAEWLNRLNSSEWQNTNWQKNWSFIPQVTYKDAPGYLIFSPQGPPGTLTPQTASLSFPHLGTLYQASKAVQQALIPKSLQPFYKSDFSDTSQVLGASSTADSLEAGLDQSKSLCGYQQVLGEATQVTGSKSPVIVLTGQADYQPAKNGFNFRVTAAKTTDYGFHIETYKFNIDGKDYAYRPGTYTPVDRSLTLTNQDLGLDNIAIKDGQTINISVTLVSKDADTSDAHQQVFTVDGTFSLKNGQFISTWGQGNLGPSPKPQVRCGNPDTNSPGDCQDQNAQRDDNPNDLICSAPYPLAPKLEVPEYAITISAGTYESWVNAMNKCKSDCDEDDEGCRKKCEWLVYPKPLSRQIGIDTFIPYLDRIGSMTISNFYQSGTNSNRKGDVYANPDQTFEAGIFDIFRPANMKHFIPFEAESDLSYSYKNGHSDANPYGYSEEALIASTQYASPAEANIYYPWLGGVQLAKKCVSQGILLPANVAGKEICREATEGQPPSIPEGPALPPSLTAEFEAEEAKIENKQQENPILPQPSPLPAQTQAEARKILQGLGYKDYVIDRIMANLAAYQKAQEITGIPWEVLAGLHAVETNFRTDNPTNGYGPMQVVDSKHEAGKLNTYEEFVNLLVESTAIIKSKVEAARNLSFIDKQKSYDQFTNDDWAQIAYFYNGRPKSQTGPDNKTYYGQEKDSWKNSGYVANAWNNNKNMYVKGWEGQWVAMQNRPGFMAHLENLQKLGL